MLGRELTAMRPWLHARVLQSAQLSADAAQKQQLGRLPPVGSVSSQSVWPKPHILHLQPAWKNRLKKKHEEDRIDRSWNKSWVLIIYDKEK